MKMIKILGLTLAAAGMMTLSTQAVPITGSIGFTGTYTQVGGTQGNLPTATSMTIGALGIGLGSDTGDLNGAGAPISFLSPVLVNGGVAGNVGSTLWSVNVGGDTYRMVVDTSAMINSAINVISLGGKGTLSRDFGAGFVDETGGTWNLSFNNAGASFTWNNTSAANVPDGGSSVILLGGAILGLFGFCRKAQIV